MKPTGGACGVAPVEAIVCDPRASSPAGRGHQRQRQGTIMEGICSLPLARALEARNVPLMVSVALTASSIAVRRVQRTRSEMARDSGVYSLIPHTPHPGWARVSR